MSAKINIRNLISSLHFQRNNLKEAYLFIDLLDQNGEKFLTEKTLEDLKKIKIESIVEVLPSIKEGHNNQIKVVQSIENIPQLISNDNNFV